MTTEWANQAFHRWKELGDKPDPKTCSQCNKVTDWEWIDSGKFWELAGDWWYDPQASDGKGYLCSRRCWRKRNETKA